MAVLELHVFYELQVVCWEQVKFNQRQSRHSAKNRHFCTTEEVLSATVTEAIIVALIYLLIQMAETGGNELTLLYTLFSPSLLLLFITIFTVLFLLFSFVDFLFLTHYGKHSDKWEFMPIKCMCIPP